MTAMLVSILKIRSAAKGALAIALLVLLAGCSVHGIVKDADSLATAGHWDEAVLMYRDANQKEPGNLDYRLKYTRARVEAARMHYKRGEEHARNASHEAATLEFQAALLLDPSLGKARSALRQTKRAMDSLYYYGKGMEALASGNDRGAKAAFKKSVSLDPGNTLAADEMEKMSSARKVVLDGQELDMRSTAPINFEFRDAAIKKVFEALSKATGINFVFDSDVRDDRTTVFLKNATFRQALDLVLATNSLSKKVVSENTIVIYPATPQKTAQYEETMIRVFYLANSDAKKAVNLLRTMLKARDISVHEELNAIVVRARPEAIELAQKILDATDLAEAEVMLEVSIMEINRNKAAKLGLDLTPDTLTLAVPSSGGLISLRDLRNLPAGDLLLGLPTAILNIKKEDLDAKILANPRIRVKNNGKARIHVGERVPIITTTVNQGVTTENVQYQDVGLKLSVEPVVRKDDEVDLKLGLEVSSLGTKTITTSGSVVYQIGTRNTETVLRLHDGETEVFGGLISDEERSTTAKVPLLGDVPVLGRLFSSVDSSVVETEILLSITPHVVKRFDVPDEATTSFPSGRDEYPSSRPSLGSFGADGRLPGPAVRPQQTPAPGAPAQPEAQESVQPLPEGEYID